ncbi:hypothetical protein L596_026973 [Steinernema carpocapsae]|uniref:Uncharacterized protein n=1 Tax=Steinernema carpocapsae TaxID=34508 RepID=A0A4U5M2X3_STECR|nr:hypothetical protein L596_026973 [Steinernema carpocapsae]
MDAHSVLASQNGLTVICKGVTKKPNEHLRLMSVYSCSMKQFTFFASRAPSLRFASYASYAHSLALLRIFRLRWRSA